jgi:hypothetical protein
MFLWWWNFTQKWQHVKYRLLLYMDEATLPDCRRWMFPFFDCPKLQRWAIDNPDLKIRDTWETYKWTAKDFISKYTKDRDYQKKRKHGSLQKIGLFHKAHTMVTADGSPSLDAQSHMNPRFRYL